MVTVHQQITYASINEKLKDNGLILRGGFNQDDQTTLLIGPMNLPFGSTSEIHQSIKMVFLTRWIGFQRE